MATAALLLLAAFVPAWRASRTRPHARPGAVVYGRRSPRASRSPAKRCGRRAHGTGARPRSDLGAGTPDAARGDSRRRRRGRHAHDHRERGPSARHAQALRAELGRRDRRRHPAEVSRARSCPACARSGQSASLRPAPLAEEARVEGTADRRARDGSDPGLSLTHGCSRAGPRIPPTRSSSARRRRSRSRGRHWRYGRGANRQPGFDVPRGRPRRAAGFRGLQAVRTLASGQRRRDDLPGSEADRPQGATATSSWWA